MRRKINPFKPNSPIKPGMFVGRLAEINAIERALIQTKHNQTQSFLLLGERGIGKTSLLNLVKHFAEGRIDTDFGKMNFLVVEVDITADTTQYSLIKKIELALRRKLAKSEKTRKIFGDIWDFLKSVEGGGFKINQQENDKELLFENFSYSLADTINRITQDKGDFNLNSTFDGVLILIDEADNACNELDLGVFTKLIVERLQKEGTEKLLFGIAGLPKTKNILINSHPSSIRIFEELFLDRLTKEEMEDILNKVLLNAQELNLAPTTFEPEAKGQLLYFSEGFPHFIHQYGFCAFESSNGVLITKDNVLDGALSPNGALDRIGNKYYKDDFYNKIKVDSYRQVLIIMAENLDLDVWITKKEIKKKFKGGESTLNNAINALKKRGIIVSKEGTRGTYRLLDKGFAWWILVNQIREKQKK